MTIEEQAQILSEAVAETRAARHRAFSPQGGDKMKINALK